MLRRRGRLPVVLGARRAVLFAASAALIALIAAGCGRDDFENEPRPPLAAEVSVKIAKDGVAVSPREFGAGLAIFTVANLTTQAGSLAINGPVSADTDEIPPAGTGQVKVDLKSGSYEASVDGIAVRPFKFTVGPQRPSAQNDLLLP